jgi:hypothetical protein
MKKRFRPGQRPTHPRLWDIDVESIVEDVRNLFAYAREGEAAAFDAHRALVAIQTAATAARARECLARVEPVSPHELAVLVGLHRSRIHQMLKNGALRGDRQGVAADSARALFEMPHLSAPPVAHRLWIAPAFIADDWKRWALMELDMPELLAPLKLPKGTRFSVWNSGMELRIPASARLSAEAAEALRERVVAHLETVRSLTWAPAAAPDGGEVARA